MEPIDWLPDKRNSISSATGRMILDGARAAEVEPDAHSKTQIAALLDLLDLHLSNTDVGRPVDPDKVVLRVPNLSTEARGAIGTLIGALKAPVQVTVLEKPDGDDEWHPATTGWDASDVSEYSRWPGLLQRDRPVPDLVTLIVRSAGLPGLRAYPMLSTQASWSLRLEGLEVGRADAKRVTMKVGKDSKVGNRSSQRHAWVEATGHSDPLTTDDVDVAVRTITAFATSWQALGQTRPDHDEHALESRILRGATPIPVGRRALVADPRGRRRRELGQPVPDQVGPGRQGPLPRCAAP